MAIRTREEYIKSLLPYNKKVFTNGDRVTDPLDHPVTRSVVEATAKMFDMANDPEFKDIMVAYSPYINENVNRNVQISRSREDLEMRYKMALSLIHI